jgi:hypothetical protein
MESDIDCGGIYCNSCLGGQGCHSGIDCQSGHYCVGLSHVCNGAPSPTSDAAPLPCQDECALGKQQCSLLPQVCTHDDAGFTLSCEAQPEGIWTCAVGRTGCTVWVPGIACGSTCCAGCQKLPCDAGPSPMCWVCPPGSDGNPCEQDTDCASAACDALTHQCVADQCADHRQDGQETDDDCGGPVCNKCQVNQRCQTSVDCQTAHFCNSSTHLCQ